MCKKRKSDEFRNWHTRGEAAVFQEWKRSESGRVRRDSELREKGSRKIDRITEDNSLGTDSWQMTHLGDLCQRQHEVRIRSLKQALKKAKIEVQFLEPSE